MKAYMAYRAKRLDSKHAKKHLAANQKLSSGDKDKKELERKEAQLAESLKDKKQRQKERAFKVSKYLKAKKAAKKSAQKQKQ